MTDHLQRNETMPTQSGHREQLRYLRTRMSQPKVDNIGNVSLHGIGRLLGAPISSVVHYVTYVSGPYRSASLPGTWSRQENLFHRPF